MTPTVPTWFNTPERRTLLLQVAKLWEGTPFFPNAQACGRDGGVDCVRLANAVYTTCAVIPHQHIEPQVMTNLSGRSVLIEAFETWPDLKARFVRLPECDAAAALPGDALCFREGAVPHHCGIMLNCGDVLHVHAPAGVRRTQLRAVVRGRRILGMLEAIYRPTP